MVDVIIAGAGPAGSVAALILARAGVRVFIIDREPFPRHKLCGDTLNPGTVSRLASLGLSNGPLGRAVRLNGMRVTGPRASVVGRYGAGVAALALTRSDLDAWLLGQAVAAGARFECGLVVRRPLVDDASGLVRGVVLSAPGGGAERRMPALVTIAADGRRSVLARAMGLRRERPTHRRWAFGVYAEDVSGMADLGEMHVRSGWYLGLAPLASGLTNVCLVTPPRPAGGTPLGVIRLAMRADRELEERLAHARFVHPVRVLGPLAADVPVPAAPGLLLAGDAAGFVDPMTGDGLHLAIRGAELAARTALETLEHGDYRRSVAALTAAHRQELGAKVRFNRTLRQLVDSPTAVALASHAARILPGFVRRAISYAGDVR